jgi:hypothetical protein
MSQHKKGAGKRLRAGPDVTSKATVAPGIASQVDLFTSKPTAPIPLDGSSEFTQQWVTPPSAHQKPRAPEFHPDSIAFILDDQEPRAPEFHPVSMDFPPAAYPQLEQETLLEHIIHDASAQPFMNDSPGFLSQVSCFAKINHDTRRNGYIAFYIITAPNGVTRAMTMAKKNRSPFIMLHVKDGKVAFPCFFSRLRIIDHLGLQSELKAGRLHDDNVRQALQNQTLGGPGWEGDGRIDNWPQGVENEDTIFALKYNENSFIMTFTDEQVNQILNTIGEKAYYTSAAKKAALVAGGTAAVLGAGVGAYYGGKYAIAKGQELLEQRNQRLAAEALAKRAAKIQLVAEGAQVGLGGDLANLSGQMQAGFENTQATINTGFTNLSGQVAGAMENQRTAQEVMTGQWNDVKRTVQQQNKGIVETTLQTTRAVGRGALEMSKGALTAVGQGVVAVGKRVVAAGRGVAQKTKNLWRGSKP